MRIEGTSKKNCSRNSEEIRCTEREGLRAPYRAIPHADKHLWSAHNDPSEWQAHMCPAQNQLTTL